MGLTQNINQFKPGVAPGDLDLSYFGGENVVSVRYDPSDTTGNIEPGEGVTLKDLGADDIQGPPIVGARSSDLTAIFGVRLRSLKDPNSTGGKIMEVAIKGAVMWFKASAALNRGVKVSLVQATPGNVQAAGTKAYLGYTLDKVAQNGMVRVMLVCDAVTAGTT
jgi:hypothetical protein